jgi:hypothetical protein
VKPSESLIEFECNIGFVCDTFILQLQMFVIVIIILFSERLTGRIHWRKKDFPQVGKKSIPRNMELIMSSEITLLFFTYWVNELGLIRLIRV